MGSRLTGVLFHRRRDPVVRRGIEAGRGQQKVGWGAMTSMSRREFVKRAAASAGTGVLLGTSSLRRALAKKAGQSGRRLFWFIPDGLRADPDLFTIFQWAREGKLPNLWRMMENGAYGHCIPTFPSHTPTNFATLFTGASPRVHGVADGPMHTEGFPLDRVSVGGFSSTAKKVAPIWTTLEKRGKHVVLLSIPGSTPPELKSGHTFRGRWGGWGADFHPLNFESKQDLKQRRKQGRGSRLFFFGPQLTRYIDTGRPRGWTNAPASYSPPLAVTLSGWGLDVHCLIHDSTDNGQVTYDRVAFSLDKRRILADLKAGEWSDWNPATLKWQGLDVPSHVKFQVVKLEPDGFFRLRILYGNLNSLNTKPEIAADEMTQAAGPMVDFVDNFPPQLVHYPEDKKTFVDEANMSYVWHKRAAVYVLKTLKPDVFIQDIYSPNQMLTGRWWMGYIDPTSARYGDVTVKERKALWDEIHAMYRHIDDIVGVMLKAADQNTIVALSSDHGAVPLNTWVRLNNLFAREGLLKFEIHPETGEPIIDWKNTQAVYLKMCHVFINPKGLAGNWTRASGSAYEALRERVKNLLFNLVDEKGHRPIAHVVKWQNVSDFLELPPDRTGDLVLANNPGFGFYEEMTADRRVFTTPLKTGYKQAITARTVKGMWTPFVIMGPGVKAGARLTEPIDMMDQYPTIMALLGEKAPDFVEGKVPKGILTRST